MAPNCNEYENVKHNLDQRYNFHAHDFIACFIYSLNIIEMVEYLFIKHAIENGKLLREKSSHYHHFDNCTLP